MDAAKRTGPISSYKVYESLRAKGSSDEYGHSIVSRDDPYWQDFFERNYRITDRYKLPSAMAWDHKEHGLIGEVIDVNKMQQRAKELDSLF